MVEEVSTYPILWAMVVRFGWDTNWESATSSLDFHLDDLPINRALRERKNIEFDKFRFKILDLCKPKTIREVLSTNASVFDPLNLAAISGEILTKWAKLKSNLHLFEKTDVPRYCASTLDYEGAELQLHHFCDTSEAGYITACFLHIEYAVGTKCHRELTQHTT